MITEDDSRLTLELPDRYVIQPAFSFWRGAAQAFPDAVSVPEDFRYASDTNKDWLDAAGLHRLLAADGPATAGVAAE
jgi:UDP-N-acetylglucosamine 4,6-dehydratase